jgi:hypothetical protein
LGLVPPVAIVIPPSAICLIADVRLFHATDWKWPVAAGDNEVNHPGLSNPVKHHQKVGAVRVKADMAGSI